MCSNVACAPSAQLCRAMLQNLWHSCTARRHHCPRDHEVTHPQLKKAKDLVHFADAHDAVLDNVLLDLQEQRTPRQLDANVGAVTWAHL